MKELKNRKPCPIKEGDILVSFEFVLNGEWWGGVFCPTDYKKAWRLYQIPKFRKSIEKTFTEGIVSNFKRLLEKYSEMKKK